MICEINDQKLLFLIVPFFVLVTIKFTINCLIFFVNLHLLNLLLFIIPQVYNM